MKSSTSTKAARVFIIIVLAATLAVVVVAARWRAIRDDEREAACKRSVAGREDNRAMWVWLFTRVDPSQPLAVEAKHQLDVLLPSLECDSHWRWHPVPPPPPTTLGG